jgi:glycosyltransferase involved in cell wall biosynthesis
MIAIYCGAIVLSEGFGMHISLSGWFWDQPYVGSGQYLHGLIHGIQQLSDKVDITLLLPVGVAHPAAPLRGLTVTTPFDRRQHNLAKLWFEQIGVSLAAKRLGADLLHVPYFAPPLLKTVPTVVSILDLIPLLLPAYRGRALVRAYMRLAALAAPHADRIIAISQQSKQDIERHLQIAPERITVTHLAAGAIYRPIYRAAARAVLAERYDLHGPFLYYVGGLDQRKNVDLLIRAYARMRQQGGPDIPLVIAGKAPGNDAVLFPDLDALIATLGLTAHVRRVEVPIDLGPTFFSAAELVAYPSRYEGFGLPPLEAMACGAAVVCARASSLPEVVADAALLANPDDEQEWATLLARALASPALLQDLRQRGIQRAAQFSYTTTAQITMACYRQVLA